MLRVLRIRTRHAWFRRPVSCKHAGRGSRARVPFLSIKLASLLLAALTGCGVMAPESPTAVSQAEGREAVLSLLKQCLIVGETANSRPCVPPSTQVLSGIRRSGLTSALGPPTWCRSPNGSVARPAAADCSAADEPGWSLPNAALKSQVGGGMDLVCEPGRDLSCSRVYYVVGQ